MKTDTTQPDPRSALLERQQRILERIASGAALEDTLLLLIQLIEEQSNGMTCAVLLADGVQQRLRYAAAPSIPGEYKRDVEPLLRIAPDSGTCGLAAFLRRPVYVRDITEDPRWQAHADLAVRNGMRAIWSTPVMSDAGVVLGTFAMHYGEPRLPSQDDMRLIDMAVQMARLAIAGQVDGMLRAMLEGGPYGILVTDLTGTVLWANKRFADMLGYVPAELRGRDVAQFAEQPLRPDEFASPEGEDIRRSAYYRSKTGARLWGLERWAVRRDAAGERRYVLIRVRNMIKAGSDPIERLSRREREVLDLVVAGHTSKEIGARLGIAAASVDSYRSRIMLKLDVADMPALMLFAIRSGIAAL